MSPFLLYIARAGLYLGLFYAFYLLLMRRTTFFRLNRTLLLSGSYLCLLLPLIRLRSVSTVAGVPGPPLVDAGADSVATDALTEPVLHTSVPWGKVLLVLYLIGAALILTLYLLSAWVNHRLVYPYEAKQKGIQGRVTVQFIVGEDGAVRNVSVLQSAHALLDAEAIRVISASPKWEPGRRLGRAVPVTYTFPVVFILR